MSPQISEFLDLIRNGFDTFETHGSPWSCNGIIPRLIQQEDWRFPQRTCHPLSFAGGRVIGEVPFFKGAVPCELFGGFSCSPCFDSQSQIGDAHPHYSYGPHGPHLCPRLFRDDCRSPHCWVTLTDLTVLCGLLCWAVITWCLRVWWPNAAIRL